MSLPLFLARRIYRDRDAGKQVSRPAVLIALIGVAIGLAVMIITVSVIVGFKSEVRGKVIGFGSDIQITNSDAARSYETRPVVVNDSVISILSEYPEIKHVQRYSTKARIRVAQYKKCIRTNFFQNRIYINQYLSGSRRCIITCRIQKIIRFP